MANPLFDRDNATIALDWLYPAGAVIEIRVPEARQLRTISGYFNSREKLLDALKSVSGDYAGVYITLNPVNPQALGRANNDLKPYAKHTTIDKEIPRRINMLIDADPVRLTGISSTDAELLESKKMIAAVRKDLTARGWPMPLVAMSGNGHHAVYAIDLPNDDDSRDLIKRCLEKLNEKHGTETCKIDTGVFNASRIFKAYGTMAGKGDAMPDRPHRMALIYAPPARVTVTREQLEDFAGKKPKSDPGKNWEDRVASPGGKANAWTKESVDAHVNKGFSNVRKPAEYQGGFKWQMDCPFDGNHKAPDAYALWKPGDEPHCHCSHDSCGEWTQKQWREKWADASGEVWVPKSYWRNELLKFADEAP